VTRSSTLLLLCATFAAASGQLLFRAGAQGRTQALQFINAPILAGLVLYALGTVLWIFALSKERLVVAYAFTALTFVLVYIGSAVFLAETVTMKAAGGVALILCGLFLIAS
jgi:undecaprenyl phosphate-alpha-L-ara4N flippase subunit ArnE